MWRSLPARVVAVLLAWQLIASTITLTRGFPYFGTSLVDNAPLWEAPIALWHLPAIELLSVSGYCCGLRNQLVFEARVRGGHVRMKPFGAFILGASSWMLWSIAALVALRLARRRKVNEAPTSDLAESAEPRP